MGKIKLTLRVGNSEKCVVEGNAASVPHSQRVNERNVVSDLWVTKKSIVVTPEEYAPRFAKDTPGRASLLSLYGVLVDIARDSSKNFRMPEFSIDTFIGPRYGR
jgi:hypothetical protein